MKINKKLTNNEKCFDKYRERKLKDVVGIAIHYTGNYHDTAYANANYFAHGKLERYAGAHYFVDGKGKIYKSIPIKRVAYSVGTSYPDRSGGGASYYGKLRNENTVSIELCDCVFKPTRKQAKACRWLVKRIRKYCPNAQNIVRHWDITGKNCPAPFVGKENKKWIAFKAIINGKGLFANKWKKFKDTYR